MLGKVPRNSSYVQGVVDVLRTLDDEIRSQDTHGGDTDASLCGAVGGAEAGEDDGAGAAHRSEERLLSLVSITVFPHACQPSFFRAALRIRGRFVLMRFDRLSS